MAMHSRFTCYLLMALTSLVGQLAAQGSTTQSQPSLAYTCTQDGNVSISFNNVAEFKTYTVSKNASLDLVHANTDKYIDTCQKELQALTNNNITLTACGLGKKLYVRIMKEKTKTIIGGKDLHEFIISCEDIPSTGVIVKASLNVTIAKQLSTTPAPVTETVSPNVVMTLTKPDQMYIGENHTLSVKLAPASTKWYVLPETCTAKSGTSNKPPATIELLKNSVTTDKEILSNFTVNKGVATADLYVFRFTDSPVVILECTVHVCSDMTCGSTFSNYGKRRKRAVERAIRRTHVVTTQFRVQEKQVTQSAGEKNVGRISVIVLAMTMLLLFK